MSATRERSGLQELRDSTGIRAARQAGLQQARPQPGFLEWAFMDMCNYRQFYPVSPSVPLLLLARPPVILGATWTRCGLAWLRQVPHRMIDADMTATAEPTRGARFPQRLQKSVAGIF